MIDNYRSMPGVNWSSLKHMDVSPLHYHYHLEHPPADSAAFRFGRAVHCAVLEPDEFPGRYVVWADGIRRGKAWDAFCAEHADRDILTAAEAKQVQACAGAVFAHPVASQYVVGGEVELPFSWADAETGVVCKGRADMVQPHRLVDLKTTRGLHPQMFAASVARYGYHAQLAFYLDGLRAGGRELPEPPAIVAVETEPPHDVAVYLAPEWVLDLGRDKYGRLLARLVECRASGVWPGVCDKELELALPRWAYADAAGDDADGGTDNLEWR